MRVKENQWGLVSYRMTLPWAWTRRDRRWVVEDPRNLCGWIVIPRRWNRAPVVCIKWSDWRPYPNWKDRLDSLFVDVANGPHLKENQQRSRDKQTCTVNKRKTINTRDRRRANRVICQSKIEPRPFLHSIRWLSANIVRILSWLSYRHLLHHCVLFFIYFWPSFMQQSMVYLNTRTRKGQCE